MRSYCLRIRIAKSFDVDRDIGDERKRAGRRIDLDLGDVAAVGTRPDSKPAHLHKHSQTFLDAMKMIAA
jgi:hypothetical protein